MFKWIKSRIEQWQMKRWMNERATMAAMLMVTGALRRRP